MPPNKAVKRKAIDDETASPNANRAKRVAQENEKFGTPKKEWLYEARRGLENSFESFVSFVNPDASGSDSDELHLDDFEIEGDGYDAAMKVEEEHEKRVEKAQKHLAIRLQRAEEVQVGHVRGEWDIYSPNYLDLREVDNRAMIRQGRSNFRQYKTGTLTVGDHTNDNVLSSMEATASLSLDGLENDWHVPLNPPQLASLELQPLKGIRQNYQGGGNVEVRLGMPFLGNGCLKMKIPGIYLAGKKEWRRHITLYGMNRTSPPREEESPEPLPRPEMPPPPEGFTYTRRGNLVRKRPPKPKPVSRPAPATEEPSSLKLVLMVRCYLQTRQY